MHLILKSSFKGIFNPGNRTLHTLINEQAQKFGIKIYDLAINWSHIHLLVRIKSREDYVKFIRSFTSILSLRAKAFDKNFENIFTLRPFTRILTWGRDFKNALNYQILNQLESVGQIIRTRKKTIKKTPNNPRVVSNLFKP